MPHTFTERISARGHRVQMPSYVAFQERPNVRPSPDRYDRFANQYQVQLVRRYEAWARETQKVITDALAQGATTGQVETIVNARLADLEIELKLLGRRRIAQAAGLGLGRRLGKRISSPGVVSAIAVMQTQNDTLLAESLFPSIREQLAGALSEIKNVPEAGRLTVVRNALLKPRAQVGRYSGGAVVATFEIQKAAGMAENEERELRGEKPIPVKWVLDPQAEHCEDDRGRGTFGCPSLVKVYPGGWATLPTVPAGNVSCLGNCVLPGNVVIAEAELGFRSPYHGPVLELIVGGGRNLTVTPNHPILTSRGFVAAQFLHEGDYVVCGPLGQEVVPPVHENNQNVPARIEQIWDALAVIARERGCSITSHATVLDFNGDGRFINGKVDIVRTDRLLLHDFDGLAFKHLCQQIFNGGGLRQGVFPASSSARQVLHTAEFTSDRIMRSTSPGATLFGGGAFHSIEHGLTAVTERVPSTDEPFAESQPIHLALGGQNLERLPGPISVEQIIEMRNFDYLGHVYDLQTVSGLYNASGVIVHNCRCHLEADFGRGFERVR